MEGDYLPHRSITRKSHPADSECNHWPTNGKTQKNSSSIISMTITHPIPFFSLLLSPLLWPHDLRNVHRHDKGHELLNPGVDGSALLHCLHDGREVVVREDPRWSGELLLQLDTSTRAFSAWGRFLEDLSKESIEFQVWVWSMNSCHSFHRISSEAKRHSTFQPNTLITNNEDTTHNSQKSAGSRTHLSTSHPSP